MNMQVFVYIKFFFGRITDMQLEAQFFNADGAISFIYLFINFLKFRAFSPVQFV